MNRFSMIERYYSEKINKHGPNAAGVDWNGTESQYIRFEQLLKVVPGDQSHYSLNDIGCGYGEILNFIPKNLDIEYYGYDLSSDMIRTAQELFSNENRSISFHHILNNKELKMSDYSIASGIFNIKFDEKAENWKIFIEDTLKDINKVSKKGFSFNLLTTYSNIEFRREDLYYACPMHFFDFCKSNFSKNVALLHDYNLFEFTVIVRN